MYLDIATPQLHYKYFVHSVYKIKPELESNFMLISVLHMHVK